jgi:hypothetical protein
LQAKVGQAVTPDLIRGLSCVVALLFYAGHRKVCRFVHFFSFSKKKRNGTKEKKN